MPVTRPRVVLVEDEAPLRRFIAMALEELPIELIGCDSVAHAMQALEQAPAALILTDLMMPVESGLDLLQRLEQAPHLRGDAKVVVLSAGLTAPVRQQLERLGVWRMIDKPVSVRQLEQLVQEAVSGAAPMATQLATHTETPVTAAAPSPLLEDHDPAHAVDTYFEGDQAFFETYRATCLEQFPHDIETAEQACAQGDLKALQIVVHSLKSVLLTLGYPRLSDTARTLEDLSRQGLADQAFAGWPGLREPLKQLLASA